jgi:hypothetical protein
VELPPQPASAATASPAIKNRRKRVLTNNQLGSNYAGSPPATTIASTSALAILTLGISRFFVSLLMLLLTEQAVGGFHIHGFWTLVDATVIVWIVNLALEFVPGPWQLTRRRRK